MRSLSIIGYAFYAILVFLEWWKMKSIVLFLEAVFIYLPVMLVFAMSPYLTKRNIAFGVTILEEHFKNEKIAKIRRHFVVNIICLGLILMVGSIIAENTFITPFPTIFLNIGIFLLLIATFVLYAYENKRVKAIVSIENLEEIKKPFYNVTNIDFDNKKMLPSPLYFISYLIIIVITFLIGVKYYNMMPQNVPMHYDFYGNVTNYANKSFKLILFAPMVQFFMSVVFIFSYIVILKAKPNIDPQNLEKSLEQNRVFKYSWAMFLIVSGFLMHIIFFVMQLSMVSLITSFNVIIITPFLLSGLMIVGSIVLSLKLGQGGFKYKGYYDKNNNFSNRNDDKYWKLGMFYYNPEDTSLFVEKRFGIGWTNNFAKPMSYVIIIGFVLFIIAMINLSKYFAK